MNRDDDDPLPNPRPDDPCRCCREETAGFRDGTPSDDATSLELFRRAIIDRDERCWREIVAIYDVEVRTWCRRAAGQALDLDELVCITWEKFWRHFSAEKIRAVAGTGRVLSYLKMCALSAVIDALRARRPSLAFDLQLLDVPDCAPAVAEAHAGAAAAAALWLMVYSHLRDERERALVRLRYELGLTSAQVQTRRPDLFPCVCEVYGVTRRVVSRLRRSPSMRAWWEDQR